MPVEMGAAIGALFLDFNIFGFGSDPIAIALALIFALAVTQKELLSGTKNYTNTVVIFLGCYAAFFSVGLAQHSVILITLTILGAIGIILNESTKIQMD